MTRTWVRESNLAAEVWRGLKPATQTRRAPARAAQEVSELGVVIQRQWVQLFMLTNHRRPTMDEYRVAWADSRATAVQLLERESC
jgi:hypothetical protein